MFDNSFVLAVGIRVKQTNAKFQKIKQKLCMSVD